MLEFNNKHSDMKTSPEENLSRETYTYGDKAKGEWKELFQDDFEGFEKPELEKFRGECNPKEMMKQMFADDMGDAVESDDKRSKENSSGEEDNYRKVGETAENDATQEKKDGSYKETRTPANHGEWSGERGNSIWYPDRDYTPPEKSPEGKNPYSNPENKTWGEILDKYGIDGIRFKDGYADFSEVSRGTVEIDGFETGGNDAKNRNFAKADVALAEQKGCTPDEVAKWRKENNYTWHECEDKKTMQKVPNEVHANVPHDGGRSQK